jgi:hypothetical protein
MRMNKKRIGQENIPYDELERREHIKELQDNLKLYPAGSSEDDSLGPGYRSPSEYKEDK